MPTYDHILTAVAATPWAMEVEFGRAVAAILSARVAGRENHEGVSVAQAAAAAREKRKMKARPKNVAVVPLYGMMTPRADFFTETSGLLSVEQVGQMVDAAAADPAVDAIVLDIDSPGGSVFGTAELGGKVAAAAAQKKTIAVANHLAASGAFWVGAQASEFVVSPSAMVGSVGVYLMHVDESEALKAGGVAVTYVASSPEKVSGASEKPLDATGRAEMERVVADYYAEFVRAVAKGRGVSQAKVREDFGRGGVVTAADAVSRGMADRVASLDDVLSRFGVAPGDGARADVTIAPAAADDRGAVEVRRRRLRMG